MKKIFSLIAAILFLVLGLSLSAYASTYFIPSTTTDDIRSDYHARATPPRLHILIAPGHEPDYGGAEYQDRKERDIVLLIAADLEKLIAQDKHITVSATRDANGWNPDIASYFTDEWQQIIDWETGKKAQTSHLTDSGKVTVDQTVDHNNAAPDSAIRLYGITKWANENDVDIVINLHLNDIPRPNASLPGPYTGFAIYVPEHQYSNASSSAELAGDIKKRLSSFINVSNMPAESSGVIEDQDLIALGSFNTSNAASILIEYSYIYEPYFTNEVSDEYFAQNAAMQTYLGLEDYLH